MEQPEHISAQTALPACSDAERRAARSLAGALRSRGRKARIETAWVRPQWATIWLVHALLGLAGSVASVEAPEVGLALCALAAISAVAELSGRFGVVSPLWPRRATQNVVSEPPDEQTRRPVRLVIAASYDTPRERSAIVRGLSFADEAIRRALHGRWPHPLGLLTLALLALAALAGARLAGADAAAVGAVQLIPTIGCLAAIGVLTDVALGRPSHEATAAEAAMELLEELDAASLRNLAVELVLAGASDGPALGMRSYVRARRRDRAPEELAVIHLEPSGPVRVWTHDGPLLAARLHPDLVRHASELDAQAHRGHGTTGALEARRARWPAIAIGGGTRAEALALALIARLDTDLQPVRRDS